MTDFEVFIGMAYFIGIMFVLFCVGKLWQGYGNQKNRTLSPGHVQFHLSDETRKNISSFNRELEKKGGPTKNGTFDPPV